VTVLPLGGLPLCGTFSELHGYVPLLPPPMTPAAATHARRVALGRKGGGDSDGDGRGVCVGIAHSPAWCVWVMDGRR
jgi:hypothetical protein